MNSSCSLELGQFTRRSFVVGDTAKHVGVDTTDVTWPYAPSITSTCGFSDQITTHLRHTGPHSHLHLVLTTYHHITWDTLMPGVNKITHTNTHLTELLSLREFLERVTLVTLGTSVQGRARHHRHTHTRYKVTRYGTVRYGTLSLSLSLSRLALAC